VGWQVKALKIALSPFRGPIVNDVESRSTVDWNKDVSELRTGPQWVVVISPSPQRSPHSFVRAAFAIWSAPRTRSTWVASCVMSAERLTTTCDRRLLVLRPSGGLLRESGHSVDLGMNLNGRHHRVDPGERRYVNA
jgi:hypothetical protein